MLDQIPLQSDMDWVKEREDGERGGGDYSKYFQGEGDCSREVINQGTAIIQRNTVCIFIACVSGGSSYNRVLAYRNNVVFT